MLLVLAALIPVAAHAQLSQEPTAREQAPAQKGPEAANAPPRAEAEARLSIPTPGPPLDPKATWKDARFCTLGGPAEVQGYRIQCNNASFLDSHIADGFIPGDHWELKSKNWDKAPNTAVTTSPGANLQWSVAGRVYNYGGTLQHPNHIDTYVECTYLHGVDVWGAASYVVFSSNGTCTVTPDPKRSRINRTP
ncbi:MAG TPA: hypothetical protein VF121_18530 [Thermoanaerobaculia bacterium]|nr:hypothetical protein [Thermoanaerobaculia bacterium]